MLKSETHDNSKVRRERIRRETDAGEVLLRRAPCPNARAHHARGHWAFHNLPAD